MNMIKKTPKKEIQSQKKKMIDLQIITCTDMSWAIKIQSL